MAAEIWPYWTSTATSTTAGVWAQQVWREWTQSSTSTSMTAPLWGVWVHSLASMGRPVPANPQWAEALRTERQAAEAKRQAAEAKRQQAAARARRIRDRHLLPEQREQLAQLGYFDLEVGSGRIYRIHGGTHGNVREMVRQPDGSLRAVASLCCQPEQVPEADAHLAQILWLKHDEETFRRIANIRPYDPQPHQAPARRLDLAAAGA
jgi:hypothetical protein